MMRIVLAAAVVAMGVSGASAQDPIGARKDAMKSMGAQARVGTQMIRGEAAFDLAKAQAIFATYASVAAKAPALFPEGSQKGDTTASPKIWEDMAGFKAAFAKFESDAKAAQASVKDLDTFKTTFPAVMKNCGGCHQDYRIKK